MNTENISTRNTEISSEHLPLKAMDYYVYKTRNSDFPEWHLFANDRSGKIHEIEIQNNASHLIASTKTYVNSQFHDETLFSHWFEISEPPQFRHGAIQDMLGGMIHFPPQLLLAWALLDLDAEATEIALSRGADLFKPVLSEHYAMDLLSLAVASRSQKSLRFYKEDERDQGPPYWSFQEIDSTDYPARAARIREILIQAGAQDFAPFRNALKKGNLDLAKSYLLKGIAIDAQGLDGLTPLLAAIFRRDLRCLRWLIHQGADCSVGASIQDWLGIETPVVISEMWNNTSRISPLTAACAVNSPEAFHILFDEAAHHFSDEDYQRIMKHKDAPEWAKEALLKGGYTTLPEPYQPSASEIRMMEYLAKPDRNDPSDLEQKKPVSFRTRVLNYITNGQTIIDWAEENAPKLLNPPSDDPVAIERLLQCWLKATGADPSPFLLRAVKSNDLSLVQLLLPADPVIMGEALIIAREHANTLTGECWDFWLDRGCITDDIRGKGVPASYIEIANAIATLLRDHGARDFTRLAKAAKEGDLDQMRREIEDGTPVNFTCDGWGSPLLSAIVGGHLPAVEYLLDLGADPNLEFDPSILGHGYAEHLNLPIDTAVRCEKPEILAALIKAGADLHHPKMKQTRIFDKGYLSREMAELLFNTRLPLIRNVYGQTCAHTLDEESLRNCRDLIHASAWNARDNDGHTPLMCQLRSHPAAVPILLSAGASPNEYSAQISSWHDNRIIFDSATIALTPVHAAMDAHDHEILEILLAAGGDTQLPTFQLGPNPSVESCQRLRAVLRDYQPAGLKLSKFGLMPADSEELDEMQRIFDDMYPSSPSAASLSQCEITLLAHYLAEDPSRAAEYPDLIIPMTYQELAEQKHSSFMEEIKDLIPDENNE